MNNDATIKFLVEIEFRLPEQGELLTSYAHEISRSFDKQLQQRMPELLYGLAEAYQAGKLEPQPTGEPGRIKLTLLQEQAS